MRFILAYPACPASGAGPELCSSVTVVQISQLVRGSSRYYAIRGQVVTVTTEGGAEHIEVLARWYLGTPYPWYGGRDQVRVILTIRADKIRQMG